MFDRIIHFLVNLIAIVLTRALIVIAIAFSLALARSYMSADRMKPPDPKYADEDGKFGSRYWVVQVCIVVVMVLFALSTHAALIWLNRSIAAAEGPADYRLWPSWAIWWFFPGFGALILSWQIVLQLWSDFVSRPAAYSFNYWWAQSAGYNSTGVLQLMAVFIALPIGLLTILALPMHTSLRQDDIRECGYAFAPCKLYRYTDARRITLVDGSMNKRGDVIMGRSIVVDFNDGRRWSSADTEDVSESADLVLAEFLRMKTQLPFHHTHTVAEIPRLDSGPKQESK